MKREGCASVPVSLIVQSLTCAGRAVLLWDMKDIRDYDLTACNTFGIKARCRRYIEAGSVAEAQSLALSLRASDRPLLVIGGGSNLLFTGDFPGTVVHPAIKGVTSEAFGYGILLCCGSGEKWDDVVRLCVSRGWHGAENLSGIPGDVGATAVQNIGAYGAEAKDIIYNIEAVEVATGRLCYIAPQDCRYAYRHSRFKDEWNGMYIITRVTYRLSTAYVPRLDYGNLRSVLSQRGIAKPTAAQTREAVLDIRAAKLPDPKEEGNAGSFFMNPVVDRDKYMSLASAHPGMPHYTMEDGREKIPAGWLIERCGWKGRALGRAAVHDKQALVLVNKGGATGVEVLRLCDAVREDVRRSFGISLQPEVNII